MTGPAAIAPGVASRSALTARRTPRRVGGVAGSLVEVALELEDEGAVDLAPAVAREEPFASGQAAVSSSRRRVGRGVPARVGRPAGGQADDRRQGRVRSPFAVERALELDVGALERRVVPVEAGACSAVRTSSGIEDRASERLVLADALAGVRLREDPGGRLVLQGGQRLARVVPEPEPLGVLLDERRRRAGGTRRGSAGWGPRARRARPGCRRRARSRAPSSKKAAQAKGAQRGEEVEGSGRPWTRASSLRPGGLRSCLAAGRHQYAIRASLPCGRDRIVAAARRHGAPDPAVDAIAAPEAPA